MNNKRLGTEFERELVKALSEMGWWVHFITPNSVGAQPFDVIAVKDGKAIAIDCKTSSDHIFRISRLEENQIFAFQKWIDCGNEDPVIAVKYNDGVYFVSYTVLKRDGKCDLNELIRSKLC